MADVASGSVLLTPRFDGLTSSITSQLNGAFSSAGSIANGAGSKAGDGFSAGMAAKTGAVVGVVSAITSRALNSISSALGSAIQRVDTMNNFPKVMKNLGYSGDEATASIQKMSKAIDGLPTSLPALTGMVQQLAPLCSNLDEATDIGIAFNNMCLASGASTADVSRAMQQYSQILAKGKPEMQDWRTLQEVMPGQLNQVAKALLGASAGSGDLFDALKSGKVSMADFNSAVMQLNKEGIDGFASFEQQARDATEGIGTAISNIPNRVARAMQGVINAIGAVNISSAINGFSSQFAVIGDAIATVVYGVKDVAGAAMDGLASAFGQVAAALPPGLLDGIASAFQTLAPAIVTAAGAFVILLPAVAGISKAIALAKGVESLGAVLTSVAGGPVALAVAGVLAVVAAFAALYNTNETVRNAVNAAWTQIQAAAAIVWPYIQLGITTACAAIQAVIMAVWPLIQQIVVGVVGAIQSFVMTAWPIIQTIFTTVMTAILAIVQTVWPIIQAVVTAAMAVIQAVVQTVMALISGDWSGVWAGIQAVASAIWSGIQSIVSAAIGVVSGVISSVLSTISGVWSSVWNGIKGAFSSIWNGIKSAASSGVNAVYATVTGIKDKILGFFSGAGTWLMDSGRAILNGLKDGIMGAVGSVTSAVSGALSKIRGLFPFSPAKYGPFSGHGYTTYSGRALMGDFGKSIASAATGTASVASRAMGTVRNALVADPLTFSADAGIGVTGGFGSLRAADVGADAGSSTNYYINAQATDDRRVIEAVKLLVSRASRQSRVYA